jgi:FkbM family methyltransferase
VNLAWWYNDHSEFFYKHVHGDKETFHFAWRRTGTEYSMPGFPIESLEGVMCQHDFQGRRIFQHRNLHKWSFFGENKRIAGFALEDDCRSHLDSLRHIWDGTIRGARERRTFKDAQVRSDSSDREVLESVALWNEYHLPPTLRGRDVILDIGAHIGSFTRACHDRGSRNIHAFEPHPENFHLLESNVGRLPGVHLHRAAMLGRRSHAKVGPCPMAQGKQNTGGAIVQESADGVPAYAIDEILKGLGYVTLLKLDCEGSEWSILAALTEWQRLGAICGEYHPRGFDSVALLAAWLRPRFRFVRIQNPNDEGLGKFWASHVKTFFSNGHLRKRQVFAQRSAARHDV